MEVETVNIDADEFRPAAAQKKNQNKGKKRTISSATNDNDGDHMQVDDVSGIEGTVKSTAPKKKKKKQAVVEIRKVPVPTHRYTPLKDNWLKIFTPIVENLKLQVRFNMKARQVEIRLSPETPDISNLQRGADFVRAFIYGFDIDDALALLRLEDLFIETFEVKDVKTLRGDHENRAVGRLAGKGGRTKFTIENVTKTRIVIADTRVHILGSYQNIQLARRAICNLILGSPPSKVYGNLRSVASRISERL